jgi:hypothetical protein
MWVKAREREKNKEKCVNGATFLTVDGVDGPVFFELRNDERKGLTTREQMR